MHAPEIVEMRYIATSRPLLPSTFEIYTMLHALNDAEPEVSSESGKFARWRMQYEHGCTEGRTAILRRTAGVSCPRWTSARLPPLANRVSDSPGSPVAHLDVKIEPSPTTPSAIAMGLLHSILLWLFRLSDTSSSQNASVSSGRRLPAGFRHQWQVS